MRILFLLFALIPIIEVTLLVQVSDSIGGWNTLAIVLLSAFIGAHFVKREGLSTIQNAQVKLQRNEVPGKELADGLMLVVAGVLLVTPGFLTDIVGVLLVLPFTRGLLSIYIIKHMQMRVVASQHGHSPHNPFNQHANHSDKTENGDVFEGEYTDKTSSSNDNNKLR